MTDLRKAAEMALEALSEYTGVVTSGTDPTKWDEVVDGGGPARKAIEALRQALAQSEHEPVAWLNNNEGVDAYALSWRKKETHDIPLYTAPPKREWVGLTDDEIGVWPVWSLEIEAFVRHIEAKLKEKNSGSAA